MRGGTKREELWFFIGVRRPSFGDEAFSSRVLIEETGSIYAPPLNFVPNSFLPAVPSFPSFCLCQIFLFLEF